MTGARSTPGCPHATAPDPSSAAGDKHPTQGPLGQEGSLRMLQALASPIPLCPQSWGRGPYRRGPPSHVSGPDPGASGRPPELRVLPRPEAAVPTHGHLRGLGWQQGSGCPGQERFSTRNAQCHQCHSLGQIGGSTPINTPWGERHPRTGGMGTAPAWVTLQPCQRFHTAAGKGGQGWGGVIAGLGAAPTSRAQSDTEPGTSKKNKSFIKTDPAPIPLSAVSHAIIPYLKK